MAELLEHISVTDNHYHGWDYPLYWGWYWDLGIFSTSFGGTWTWHPDIQTYDPVTKTGGLKRATVFTAQSRHTVTSVKLAIASFQDWVGENIANCNVVQTAGTIYFEIKAVDGDNHPIGDALASATIDGETIPKVQLGEERAFPVDFALTEIPLSGDLILEKNAKYALIIWNDGLEEVTWYTNYSQMTYKTSWLFSGGADNWQNSQWYSPCFEIWGVPLLKKPTDPTPEHEEEDVVSPEPGDPITPELPLPEDATVDVALDLEKVRFKQGGGATGYKIYHNFANAGSLVLAATITATDATNPTVGTQEEYLLTTELLGETLYSWRVDATAGSETVTGDVWTFTTLRLPEKATLVSPPSDTDLIFYPDVPGSTPLVWADPGATDVNRATQYRLYFGHTSLFLGSWESLKETYEGGKVVPRIEVTASAKEVNYGNYYTAGSNYSWRIDSYNSAGKTIGDVWEFDVKKIDWPPDEDDDDDEEGGDDEGDGTGDITVAGGGRHGSYLIVVTHKKVYIRRA